ncbi:hypothetical protein N9D31_00820 [Oligoflexaceae bacterium]|nr:hypothetical protein [Oligoflexaceae bacterium]
MRKNWHINAFLFIVLFWSNVSLAQNELFVEISQAISATKRSLSSAEDLHDLKALVNQLESNPNAEAVGKILETVDQKAEFLKKFYQELTKRVHENPDQLLRIKNALKSFKSDQRSSALPVPNFSRSWAGFGILLAVNDFAFSRLTVINEMNAPAESFIIFAKSALVIATIKFGISILADAIVTKKAVSAFVDDYRQRRKSKLLASDMLKIVRAESEVRKKEWEYKGSEFGIQNLSGNIEKLLLLDQKLETGSPKLLERMRRYLSSRRIEKIIAKASEQLSPVEKNKLHLTLLESAQSKRFEVDAKVVALQEQLIKDIRTWETLHPENHISDLIAESVAAEKALKHSRVLALRPHFIASVNYFLIGFALTLGSDAATVGIMEAPFENPISTLFRNHREAITFYSSLTGVIATAIHLLTYPLIRKQKNAPREHALLRLKGVDPADWKLFRRSAMLAQMDFEIEESSQLKSRAVNENAYSAVRTLMSKNNYIEELVSPDSECPSAL